MRVSQVAELRENALHCLGRADPQTATPQSAEQTEARPCLASTSKVSGQKRVRT